MLEGRGLCKAYQDGPRRVDAVGGVTLTVARGEFLAVCGRSGSGKSTLLAMLGGLARPTAGSVLLDGADVWRLAPDRLAELRGRRVGFVFQFASLLPSLRAVDNVALPGLLAGGASASAVGERAERLLAEVGLADRSDAFPHELSGGEQRRVALARALINEPDLLLADEPTSDLDEQTEAQVFGLLLSLRRSRGATLVVVTHDEALAARADRIIRLAGGRVESEEPPAESNRTVLSEASPPRQAVAPPAVKRPAEALGVGFARRLAAVAVWAVALTLTLVTVNFGVSLLQQRATQERHAARQAGEQAALSQLRADVEDIAFGPDGTYRLTLYLQNLEPERGLSVTSPAVGVFVQAGGGWQEVPAHPVGHEEGHVVSVGGRERFVYSFKPGTMKFEEILPGYMHVRVTNTMLVSPGGAPGDELFERSDNYYVWLLPQDADPERVSRLNHFAGKPPVWIPMPPH